MPVTHNRNASAAGFNQHVRQDHAGLDFHGRDVRHVNGFFLLPIQRAAERRWSS
jgi:hypothetical protein